MVEELLVTRTEIVQTILAARCLDEAVLWTAAVADETDFAVQAILGQSVTLVGSELPLERRFY